MLDVASSVCEAVEEALSLPFMIYTDQIPQADDDGVCLRHDPAPAAQKRYLDGTRLLQWNLTFYVRAKHAEDARAYAKRITDALDEAVIDAHGTQIYCDAQTLPQYIDTDDKERTTYSAAITARYLEQGE